MQMLFNKWSLKFCYGERDNLSHKSKMSESINIESQGNVAQIIRWKEKGFIIYIPVLENLQTLSSNLISQNITLQFPFDIKTIHYQLIHQLLYSLYCINPFPHYAAF